MVAPPSEFIFILAENFWIAFADFQDFSNAEKRAETHQNSFINCIRANRIMKNI